MPRNLLLLSLALVVPTAALAQTRYEVTPFVGARLGGAFRAAEQDLALDVKSSLGGGVLFDYALNDAMQLEFSWSRQSSDVEVFDVSPSPGGGDGTEETPVPGELPKFPIRINYFHGSFLYGGGPRVFRPYVLAGVGMARLNPDVEGVSTTSKFSFSLGTGFKSFFTDRFGFRFDARAFGTRAGGRQEDIACGVFGCVSFETASTFWQGQLVGGLIIAF